MSSYPEDPKFEMFLEDIEGADGVAVYCTSDGYIFICAPDVDPPCFTPDIADLVCAAIQQAAEVARPVLAEMKAQLARDAQASANEIEQSERRELARLQAKYGISPKTTS